MPEIYFKPRHPGQRRVAEVWDESQAIVITGMAGTGKTSISLALALSKSDRVVLCRPAVPIDEDLGFIPGDLGEKLKPWLSPFTDVLQDMSSGNTLEKWGKKVEVVSVGLLGGRTIKNATLVADEAQNLTYRQIVTALTRVGENGRVVLCGDYDQSVLPDPCPLKIIANKLTAVKGASVIHFDASWQQRSEFVRRVLEVL